MKWQQQINSGNLSAVIRVKPFWRREIVRQTTVMLGQ
jgi:hypothetical protein